MALPNLSLKFNIMTVVFVAILVGLLLAACAWGCMNKGKLMENFENGTQQYDPYAPLKGITGGPVPLPENQLDFFFANKFDGSCCAKPQQYSSSTGCACISPEQMKYLNRRGGNNTEGGNNVD